MEVKFNSHLTPDAPIVSVHALRACVRARARISARMYARMYARICAHALVMHMRRGLIARAAFHDARAQCRASCAF